MTTRGPFKEALDRILADAEFMAAFEDGLRKLSREQLIEEYLKRFPASDYKDTDHD